MQAAAGQGPRRTRKARKTSAFAELVGAPKTAFKTAPAKKMRRRAVALQTLRRPLGCPSSVIRKGGRMHIPGVSLAVSGAAAVSTAVRATPRDATVAVAGPSRTCASVACDAARG
jgi:hypothetical protein